MRGPIQIALTVTCGVCALFGWIFGIQWVVFLGVVAGSPFALRAAYLSIRDRELDVNFLMILAALGSVLLNHPAEAATLLFLFSLSNTLERYAMGRTESAIAGLIKLRPDSALLITESGDTKVPVESLKVGDEVRVVPFDQFPSDAIVTQGSSTVNESAMTGEALPVTKTSGDKVLAGTQNLDGMLVVKVTHEVGDTALEKIVQLVRQAQENKASGERISQWFGSRYTIFVFVVFCISFLIRFFIVHQELREALYHSFSLLVALSPCALVISSPATTLSALAWAAGHGILIRGGHFIEEAGRIDTVALDKTGTLTKGEFLLREICVCHKVEAGVSRNEDACWHGGPMSSDAMRTLTTIAAAEQYSHHPIAQAIVRAAVSQGLKVPEAKEQSVAPGLGVLATVDGTRVKVGQLSFFPPEDLPSGFLEHVQEMQAAGYTTAIGQNGSDFAALAMGDEVRSTAARSIEQLKELTGSTPIMLTGDSEHTASAVAKQVGVTDVRAALMPDEKEAVVASMIDQGRKLMMVGDGVNDAPSLARANLGVAMGGLGSDIALNSADVVLMRDKLESLVDVIRLGRLTNRIIRANLSFSAGMIICLAVGSLLAEKLIPAYSSAILPVTVFGHEGSTVLVILNGLRLLRGPGHSGLPKN